jgi:hypothetical protein
MNNANKGSRLMAVARPLSMGTSILFAKKCSRVPEFDDNCKEALSGFYLTLVSIVQSLILGYLFQVMWVEIIGPDDFSFNTLLQAGTSLLGIILVWHIYAVGAAAYSWKLDIWDSVIPFAMGICQYAMIAALSIQKTNAKYGDVRYILWLWSLVGFALVSVFAYFNQYKKADPKHGSINLIPASKMNMTRTLKYLVVFAFFADCCSIWKLPENIHWVVSLIIMVSFLLEMRLFDRTYYLCSDRRRGEHKRSRLNRGMFRN